LLIGSLTFKRDHPSEQEEMDHLHMDEEEQKVEEASS
jgi:hypothetical protein